MKIISLIGIILKGRYCILEQIGSGGGGSLYLARDMELGVVWAVKEIPVKAKKEARFLLLLDHPALPKMVDYVERGEFCYLIMEYIRGKSLGQLLRGGKHFSPKEVLEIGISLSKVFQYLHTRKPPVFYGDLKPDNLILAETGHLYLVDFGSAVNGYRIQQKVCFGTEGYAAPEQYQGRMGAASDVFALGKTLLTLMGKDRWNCFRADPRLFLVLTKCSRKDEKRRYGNMEQVQQALSMLQKQGKRKKGFFPAAMILMVLLLFSGWMIRSGRGGVSFEDAVTSVTDHYYQNAFLDGGEKERKKICENAEAELQRLLKVYRGDEEQKRLLMLLAYNEEMSGETDRAELCYEQLLLYEPDFWEGYAEYGNYLWRQGRYQESRTLLENYRETAEQNHLFAAKNHNMKIWMERAGNE